MTVSNRDFWRLLVKSGLRSEAERQILEQRFARAVGGDEADAMGLAKWLVSQRAITRYQAKMLLSGRAGPFVYGPYVLRDRLSQGRLSGCFRAVHAPTKHPVVLWFLSGSVVREPERYAVAVAQLAIASQTVDPCLSRTYELVDLGRFKFVVIEDLNGGSADEALAARGPLRGAEACRVMRQVALGAAALHGRDILHGDIRPQNVWIDLQGNGRLLQVPLSREPHLMAGFWAPLLAASSGTISTERERYADYAAAELADAGQPIDALTDVYAIGCTLYELLSGRPPFAGGNVAEKMLRHATEAIQPLEPLGVPAGLAKVVAYAMAKDRRLRYQTATDLAEALAYFVEPEQKDAMPQPTSDPVRRAAFEAAQGVALGGEEARRSSPVPPILRGEDTPAQLANVAMMQEEVTPTIVVRERRKQSRNKGVFVLALLLALGIGGGVGYVMSDRGDILADHGEDVRRNNGEAANTNGTDDGGPNDRDGGPGPEDNEIRNANNGADALALWAAPTAGEPISWAYLPPRAEIVIAVRPAQLLRHAEGEKLVATLGPHGAGAWAAAEEAIGMPLAEVDHLTVAWTNSGGEWTASYVVWPTTATTAEMLEARWGGFQSVTQGDKKYFVARERAYFAPAAEQGKLLVVTTAAQMPEVMAAGKEATPLWREMVKLLRTSDSDKLCTLLFTTQALIVEARPAFVAERLEQLHDAITALFPEHYRGATLSLHLDEQCYLEGRLIPDPQTTTAVELANAFRERMQRIALDVEEYVSRIGLDPHSGRVLIRLGSMARFVERQLRVGVEDDQVVLNCYLPAMAAHNLALGAELAIVQPRGGGAASPPGSSSAAPAAGEKTLTQRLRSAITIVQTGDTLERALQTISAEIGAPSEILGGDLVSEGITRNNRFDLDIKDTPAGEALRTVLLKANPEGKLVYVVKPKSPGGEEVLFVTTRAAAQRRGDALPAEFGGQ